MAIITLTSDLGDDSHYVAILKGIILDRAPSTSIIDVTHKIPNFDVLQAAFVLGNVVRAYPKDSIHIVGVDPESQGHTNGLVMRCRDQLFIGPDNGVLSLIARNDPAQIRGIDNTDLLLTGYPASFRAARVFAPVAGFLAAGGDLKVVGEIAQNRELRWGEPTYVNNCLRGKIIYIDRFGNAVTNITRPTFLDQKADRGFQIYVRSLRLRRIVTTYSDVEKTDALAIFGESDHLEIAIREASAAQLLGLKVNDMITIEFGG